MQVVNAHAGEENERRPFRRQLGRNAEAIPVRSAYFNVEHGNIEIRIGSQ